MPTIGRVAEAIRAAATPYALGVAATTAALTAFLLARLHAWPPNEDETLVFFLTQQPFGDMLDTVMGERGGAPLHFLLAWLVGAGWPGLTGLRLISVAFAVASIPLAALLVSRLAGRRIALVSVVLMATSWTTLIHGIYGRMYGLFLFTSLLSFLALTAALARPTALRWGLWGLAALAVLATMPYGVLVLAAQGAYVLARRTRTPFPLLPPALAALGVVVAATPLWRSYLVLADRFEGGTPVVASPLETPLDVLTYVRKAIGDFTAGWTVAFAVVVVLAAAGLWTLARSRPRAAALAVTVVAVPALALLALGLGSTASPETRHLIFALPFIAMLVAAGLLAAARAAGRHGTAVLSLGLALLVAVQVAWGWHRTPELYAGQSPVRIQARHDAAAWLAATARPDDVYLAYDPLFLDAWDAGGLRDPLIVPRADPQLALETLERAGRPLGRGVWVHDASENQSWIRRLEIQEETPGPGYVARAFGPFLVIRTTAPVRTPAAFLEDTVAVQALGMELLIGDAETNYITALEALRMQVAGRPG